MSKRSRRSRNEARLVDHPHDEPRLMVSGSAFQQFEASLEQQLDLLVGRWIHVAAPAAFSVRRVPTTEVRPSEQT